MTLPAFNPVALKELRQLTRTRIIGFLLFGFPALLFILVAICFATASEYKTALDLAYGEGCGEAPFYAVLITTGIATVIILPTIASLKTAIETSKERLGLEFTTTLTSGQIVNGKIIAPVLLIAALIAISMPFLAFSYLMRGIPLYHVFLAPFLIFLGGLVEVVIGLPLALSRPTSLPMRIIYILGAVGFVAFWVSITTTAFVVSSSSWIFHTSPVSLLLFGCLGAGILLIFLRGLATFQIAPPYVDSERPLRRLFAILFVLSIGVLYIPKFESACWSAFWVLCGGALFFRSSFSPREMPRIVRAQAPRSFLLRLVTYPFATGPAAGQTFGLILLVLALLPSFSAYFGGSHRSQSDLMYFVLLITEAVALTSIVSALVHRYSSRPRVYHLVQTGLLFYFPLINVVSGILSDAARHTGVDFLVECFPCSFVGIEHCVDKGLVTHFTLAGLLLLAGMIPFIFRTLREFNSYRRHD